MKLSPRLQEILKTISRARARVFALLSGCVVVLVLLSFSGSICVRFPILMWIRSDVCKTFWAGTNYTPNENSYHYKWWQTACLIERDWDTMEYHCKNLSMMGNWPVCLDQQFGLINKSRQCIVYSFGIDYDFRFDDAMSILNCTVFSFDPSMSIGDHKRGARVHFRKIGLAAADNSKFKPRQDSYTNPTDRWKVMTLTSIMAMLGHTPSSLSVLKMDIESNEWKVLSTLLKDGVLQMIPQVLIEWHLFSDSPPRSQYQILHENYNKFKDIGFRNFWVRNEGRNHWLPRFETQAEVAYVNLKYGSNS